MENTNTFIARILSKLEAGISYGESVLNPETPAITNTPWIIASLDKVYTLTEKGGDPKIEVETFFPTRFTPKAAREIIENIKAHNANGPIAWERISPEEYYRHKLPQWKESYNLLKAHYQPENENV